MYLFNKIFLFQLQSWTESVQISAHLQYRIFFPSKYLRKTNSRKTSDLILFYVNAICGYRLDKVQIYNCI